MNSHTITISHETFEYLHEEVSGEYVGLNIVEAIVEDHKDLKRLQKELYSLRDRIIPKYQEEIKLLREELTKYKTSQMPSWNS